MEGCGMTTTYTPGRPGPDDEEGYGFFHVADPRDFFPDEEDSTPEEIAAHREACEKAERGEPWGPPDEEHGPWVRVVDGIPETVLGQRPEGEGWVGQCHAARSFGIGTYIIRGGYR
jgi:hypothetical protein